eukprot:2392141-Prymnesium_polylepis.2
MGVRTMLNAWDMSSFLEVCIGYGGSRVAVSSLEPRGLGRVMQYAGNRRVTAISARIYMQCADGPGRSTSA